MRAGGLAVAGLVVVVGALALAPAVAGAQPGRRRTGTLAARETAAHVAAAETARREGDLDSAAAGYDAAYRVGRDPQHLLESAILFDAAGDRERALAQYWLYVNVVKSLAPERRDEILRRMGVLTEPVAALPARPAPAPRPAAPPATVPVTTPRANPPVVAPVAPVIMTDPPYALVAPEVPAAATSTEASPAPAPPVEDPAPRQDHPRVIASNQQPNTRGGFDRPTTPDETREDPADGDPPEGVARPSRVRLRALGDDEAQPRRTRVEDYGNEILLAGGLSAVIMTVGFVAEEEVPLTIGVLGGLLVPSIVHMGHGNTGRGVGMLLLRGLGPLIFVAASEEPAAYVLGFSVVLLAEYAWWSTETVVVQPTVARTAAGTPTFGVAGSF